MTGQGYRDLLRLAALLAACTWALALMGGCVVVTGGQVCGGVQTAGLGRSSPDPYHQPAVATASVCVDVTPRTGGR